MIESSIKRFTHSSKKWWQSKAFFFASLQRTEKFWENYPILHFALFFLFGLIAYQNPWNLTLAPLFLTRKQGIRSLIFVACGFLYISLFFPTPPLSASGSGIFHIQEIKRSQSPFQSSLVYVGKLKTFQSEGKTYRGLPCRIYVSGKQKRPQANRDYVFQDATLQEIKPNRYVLKPTEWQPIERSFSLAEMRFDLKEKLKRHLMHYYKGKRELSLMRGLLTGQLENPLLAFQFGKVGLEHLLAISGFHFVLISTLCFFLLKRVLSDRLAATLLLFFLFAYFLYMGPGPSISRAWIGALVFLCGHLFHLRPTGLNALGCGLAAALILSPTIILDIGFQLSFSATLGILLFFRPCEKALELWLPKQPFSTLINWKRRTQFGYLFSSFLRSTLALNLSVLTFILPFLLFHFHRFPLISLLYNLFFPILFSGLMLLLLCSFLCPPLHAVTNGYALFLLDFVTYAPTKWMVYLRVKPFSPLTLAVIVAGVGFLGIYLWERSRISLK